jgi:two-component system nitrogen regulation response regulator GlnG
VSDSDLSVLITGETGTGKELVGSAIHRHSRRSDKAYLAIAPAALNAELIESELFGHVKGAFTGASEDRAGLFEKAEGGTILLDEIGELPLGIQVKLLRVLEQGDYCRVGETKSRKCNVRIIAATNRDLQKAVTEGVFREDLYFRLNGLQIRLPALRERIEDLGILSTHFLTKVQYPEGSRVLSDKLLEQLSRRDWPGNIRQLRNAIEHAAVNARGRSLVIEDFPPEQPLSKEGSRSDGVDLESLIKEFVEQEMKKGDGSSVKLHERLLERIEPILLLSVLRESQGNKIKAAEMLGIHRGTLRERLKHYRIED